MAKINFYLCHGRLYQTLRLGKIGGLTQKQKDDTKMNRNGVIFVVGKFDF